MNLKKEIYGEAEYGICTHCGEPIIRWPNRGKEYSGTNDKRWLHNPSKGFRLYHCKSFDTEAWPA